MPRQKQIVIVEALNCVSKFHSYAFTGGRFVEKELGFTGHSREISQERAVECLENYIRTQRKMLEQAQATLREIREEALVEAELALAEATGD